MIRLRPLLLIIMAILPGEVNAAQQTGTSATVGSGVVVTQAWTLKRGDNSIGLQQEFNFSGERLHATVWLSSERQGEMNLNYLVGGRFGGGVSEPVPQMLQFQVDGTRYSVPVEPTVDTPSYFVVSARLPAEGVFPRALLSSREVWIESGRRRFQLPLAGFAPLAQKFGKWILSRDLGAADDEAQALGDLAALVRAGFASSFASGGEPASVVGASWTTCSLTVRARDAKGTSHDWTVDLPDLGVQAVSITRLLFFVPYKPFRASNGVTLKEPYIEFASPAQLKKAHLGLDILRRRCADAKKVRQP
jgi:hypothetical protein